MISFSELELVCNGFEKFNILNLVLQAVGDIEPYVQSSALNVLSAVISRDIVSLLSNLFIYFFNLVYFLN